MQVTGVTEGFIFLLLHSSTASLFLTSMLAYNFFLLRQINIHISSISFASVNIFIFFFFFQQTLNTYSELISLSLLGHVSLLFILTCISTHLLPAAPVALVMQIRHVILTYLAVSTSRFWPFFPLNFSALHLHFCDFHRA